LNFASLLDFAFGQRGKANFSVQFPHQPRWRAQLFERGFHYTFKHCEVSESNDNQQHPTLPRIKQFQQRGCCRCILCNQGGRCCAVAFGCISEIHNTLQNQDAAHSVAGRPVEYCATSHFFALASRTIKLFALPSA
jgi:hypothetical protein